MSNRGFFAEMLFDIASVFRIYRAAAISIVCASFVLGMIVTAVL